MQLLPVDGAVNIVRQQPYVNTVYIHVGHPGDSIPPCHNSASSCAVPSLLGIPHELSGPPRAGPTSGGIARAARSPREPGGLGPTFSGEIRAPSPEGPQPRSASPGEALGRPGTVPHAGLLQPAQTSPRTGSTGACPDEGWRLPAAARCPLPSGTRSVTVIRAPRALGTGGRSGGGLGGAVAPHAQEARCLPALRRAGSIARGPASSWCCVRAPRLRLLPLPPGRGRSRRDRGAGRMVRTRGGPACSRRPAWRRRRALKSAAFAAAAPVRPGRAPAKHPVRRVRLAGGRRSRGAAPWRRGDITGGAEEEKAAPRAPGLSGARWRGAGWAGRPPHTCTWGRRSARAGPAPACSSSVPSPPASLLEERSGAAEGWPVRKGRCLFLVPVFVF